MHAHSFIFETVIYFSDLETPERWTRTRELMLRSGMEMATFYYIREHELRHQAMEVISPRIERIGRCAGELRAAGLHTAGALLPSLSWGQATEEGPFEKIVGSDGTRSGVGSCPLDPKLRSYLLDIAGRLAKAGFTSVSLEDDFQTSSHRPVRDGCFCERHLALFSQQENKAWTRPALAEAMAADPALRSRWEAMKVNVLAELAQAVQQAAGGAKICLLGGAEVNANPVPIFARCSMDYVRPAQGQYVEAPCAALRAAWGGAMIAHQRARQHGVKTMAEITSWPRNAFTKSWTTMMLQTALSAYLGIDGALFWAGHGPRDAGFERAVTGWRGWYDILYATAQAYPHLVGVHAPNLRTGPLMLARTGVPMTFDPDHAWLIWGREVMDIDAMKAAGVLLSPGSFAACEQLTRDPINGSYAGWPSTCLTLLQPDDFRTLAEVPAGARVLARFLDNDSREMDPSVVLDERDRRLLLCHTPAMWEKVIGEAKAWQLHHALEAVLGRAMPVSVLGAADVCPLVRQGPDGLAVLLANLSNDAAVGWTLRLGEKAASVERANDDGEWTACDLTKLTLPPHSATLLRLIQ